MKYLVNGEERELAESSAQITSGEDRLFVQSENGKESALAVRVGDVTLVSFRGHSYRVEAATGRRSRSAQSATGELLSPMPGVLVEIKAAVGDRVAKGQVVAILEAMKTQQPLVAPFDGVVETLPFTAGNQVDEGVLIAKISP